MVGSRPSDEQTAEQGGRSLGPDRHFEDTIALVREKFVGALDIVERKAMSDERGRVDTAGGDHLHQAPHALLAARA